MALRVAIQGYGRIGRMLHRKLIERPVEGVKVVAINARSSDTKTRVHLLKYDSLHGKMDASINFDKDIIYVNDEEIISLKESDIINCPWENLDIDVVLDTTGKIKTKEDANNHIMAGAKKVLVSAPMNDDTKTIVFGVNDDLLKKSDIIISNASCTTNCIAPPMKILHEKFEIKEAYVSSIHSFTHSQNLLDNASSDLRRSRSAVQSVIPTTSGAMRAINKVIPSLEGKVDGLAFRVPIATSSICDIRFSFEKKVDKNLLNHTIEEASKNINLKNIIDVSKEELVSIDFKTNSHSSILDIGLTKTIGNTAQMLFWYDNEWGYISRLIDFLKKLSNFK
jgi:glyceraldehyde 3-phosphate dehydrogenase